MADKIDISSFQIAASKMHANGNAYFKLFEKHVPRDLDQNSVVLLYKLDNLSCIYKIVNMNSKAHYVVVSNDAVNNALQVVLDKAIDVKYIKEFDFKETDMKFDCIVMNPPYQRNLHLKILAEAIKHLKDEKSMCVNLSPILWLEDPHAHMKQKSNLYKFQNAVASHIDELEIVGKDDANSIFGAGLFSNLGIYSCKKNQLNKFDTLNFWKNNYSDIEVRIFEKVYNYSCHLSDKIESNKRDGIRVLIAFIAGNRGTLPIYKDLAYVINGKKDGKDWTKCKNNGGYEKEEGMPLPCSIKFETEVEAQNFYDSWKSTFCRWLCKHFLFDQNIVLSFLPFMQDYSKPWDDARFYKFFNITPDEQKVIEETMEKYDSK